MIKAGEIQPGFDIVTSLTTLRRPVRPQLGHPVTEFAVMRIGMAAQASSIFKPVGNYFGRVPLLRDNMTLGTGHGEVGVNERESTLLMLGNRIRRWLEPADVVTFLTMIAKRCRGELALVHVRMAVQAMSEGDFVARRRPSRDMAFRAGHRGMPALEGISGRRVFFHSEE